MKMLDQVVQFDWDGGNQRKSHDKHGVTQSEAEQVFFNAPLLVVVDQKHSKLEPRWHALGKTDQGRTLHLTFTLRGAGKALRVISVRDMHRKERVIYEQVQP